MKKQGFAQGVWAIVALCAITLTWWVAATQMDRSMRALDVPARDPKGVEAVNGRYVVPVEYDGRMWTVPPTSLVESGIGTDLIAPLAAENAETLTIAHAKEKKILYPDFSGAVLSKEGEWIFVPEQVLAWHGIAFVGGGSLDTAVTYSPFTETISVHGIEGTCGGFGRTGYVWNNNDVVVDGCGTFFLQATGETLAWSTQRESEAPPVSNWNEQSFDLMTFAQYEKAHPQGKVWMPKDTESIAYNFSPLGGYRESKKNIMFPLTSEWNHALPRKSFVYGVAMDGLVKAYDPALLAKENRGVLTEKVGEKNYVVWVGEDGAVRMHEAGANVFKYASNGGLTDKLGYTWMVEKGSGNLVRGTVQLAPVPLMRSFWFFWSVLHPDTHLYAMVASKGLVNGPIDLKEEEGETKADDSIKIDVDPTFGGKLEVKEAK